MMSASNSSENIRAISEFFQMVLEPFDEPIYYDRLRGYVSSSSDEVRLCVRKHYRGEELLKFFKRRREIFTVTEDNCVELNRKDKKKKKTIFDDEDAESTKSSVELKPRKRQRMKVPRSKHLIPSVRVSNSHRTINDISAHALSIANIGPKDMHSASVWGQQEETVNETELEEDTLEYFKEHFRHNRDSHFDLKYHLLPLDVKAYLQLKYTTNKIHRFLLEHCNTFLLDDDGFVTVVEVDLHAVAEDPESLNDFSEVCCDELNVEANPDDENLTADCIEQASEKNNFADSVITDGNKDSRNQQLINSPGVSSNYADIVSEEHEDADCNETMNTSEESVIDNMIQEFLNSEELNKNDIHQENNSPITIKHSSKKCEYDDSTFSNLNEENVDKASDMISTVKLPPHSIHHILIAEQTSKWTKELSAVYFFIKVIEQKHNSSVLIEKIRGRLAQAPKDACDYIRSNFKGIRFKKFFTTYPKIFFVNKQEVRLSKGYVSHFKEMEKCGELSTTTQNLENHSLEEMKDNTTTKLSQLQHSMEKLVESEAKEANERENIPSANFLPTSDFLNLEHDIQTEAEKSSGYTSVSTLEARVVSELPFAGNEKAEQTVAHNFTSDQTTCFGQLEALVSDSNTTEITHHKHHLPDEIQLKDLIHTEDKASDVCWAEVSCDMSKVDCRQSIIQGNTWDCVNSDMGNNISSIDSDTASLKNETLVMESEKCANSNLVMESEKCANSNLVMESEKSVNSESIIQGNELDYINSDLDKNISSIDSNAGSLKNENLVMEFENAANSQKVKYAGYQLTDNSFQLNHLMSANYSSEVDDTLYEHTIMNHETVDRYIFSESECFTISKTCSNKDISDEDSKESFVENNHSCCSDNMQQEEIKNTNSPGTCNGDLRKPLIENKDSDIKNCSQLITDLRGIQRNTTIYDRDCEDALQEQVLENFPTYFSRFVCLYREEQLKGDIDTIKTIENSYSHSEVLDSNDIFDDESNDTLCISDTDNEKVGSIDDAKEQMAYNSNENCTSEVNVHMNFLTPTVDETNTSDGEHFSLSVNELDDKVGEDKEEEIPLEKNTLVNDPFLNGSESSFIDNGKIRNVDSLANSINVNEVDTSKFPLCEDDAIVKTPYEANGDIVLKNLFKGNDIVLSKKLDENSDVVTLKDIIQEDEEVPLNDKGKENVTDILETLVSNIFSEDLIEDHNIASSIEKIDTISSKVKEEEYCEISVVSSDTVASKVLMEHDISKCAADEDGVVIQKDLVEDEVNESAHCEASSNQSSDVGLTSDTEYLSYSPSRIFVTHSNACDNAHSPTEGKSNIMTNESFNIVKNSVDVVEKCNGSSKDIEDTFTMDTLISPGSEDTLQEPKESDIDSGLNNFYSNNDGICNAKGANKKNFWFSEFSTRKHLAQEKHKFKPLEVNCSNDNPIERGFGSALSTNSQEKMESCASDTLTNSPTYQKSLQEQNSMSSSGRGDSLSNAQEGGCRSPSSQSEDDVFSCHAVASSFNEMVTVFYGYVILLTKNACIAKCIENGLPIFCSTEFFKCHKHKTGLDACFGALTIGDMVCCSVLSPSPGTDIMTSCQFSIAENKNESLSYWSPCEARNPVSQTHTVENGQAKTQTVVEVRDTSCQTISTGDIFLTQYHF